MPAKCLWQYLQKCLQNVNKNPVKVSEKCHENACEIVYENTSKCWKNASKTARKNSLNNASKMPRVTVALHYMAWLSYGYGVTDMIVFICCHFSPKANTSNANDEFSKVRAAGISKCD